jgi:hypothetical protein
VLIAVPLLALVLPVLFLFPDLWFVHQIRLDSFFSSQVMLRC